MALYVSWRLAPAVKVSFDSRYEVAYPPGALERDKAIYAAAPGWPRLLLEHGATAAIVQRDQPLAAALPGPTGWQRTYRDEVFEVWAPVGTRGLPPGEVIGRARDGVFPDG